MEKKRTTQKNEDKHKYGPRTSPKPRGWMHQGLYGSKYHLMDVLGVEVEGNPRRPPRRR